MKGRVKVLSRNSWEKADLGKIEIKIGEEMHFLYTDGL